MDFRYVHHLTEEMKEILRSSGVKLPLLAPMHHGQVSLYSHLMKLPLLKSIPIRFWFTQGICSELDDESAIKICNSYQEKVAACYMIMITVIPTIIMNTVTIIAMSFAWLNQAMYLADTQY